LCNYFGVEKPVEETTIFKTSIFTKYDLAENVEQVVGSDETEVGVPEQLDDA
jgi:hypothetical protein